MRSRFGVMYLNNWKWGGNKDSRGFRSHLDKEGATMSQHRFGRATDCTFKSVSVDGVREDIIANWKEVYLPMGITCIESTVPWLHSDMRFIPEQKSLLIVNP